MWVQLQVRYSSDRLVLVEPGSVAGSMPAVARAATSAGGNFISVYWWPNGDFDMLEAVDGEITANFYPRLLNPGEKRPTRAALVQPDMAR